MAGKHYDEVLEELKQELKITGEKLNNCNALLKSILESINYIAVHCVDSDLNYLYYNETYKKVIKKLFLFDVEIGMNSLVHITSDEQKSRHLKNYKVALSGETIACIHEYCDSEKIYYDTYYNPYFNENNEVIGIVAFAQDITERKMIEKELQENQERYKTLFQMESDSLFLLDKETGAILDANNAACRTYGYTIEELLKLKNTDMSAEPEKTKHATDQSQGHNNLIPVRYHKTKEGAIFPVEITASVITLGSRDALLVASRDITERKKTEHEIHYFSFHDQLTGLYNLRYYEEELARLDSPRNYPLTIVMGDVNGLKLINDSFGHSVGDDLLKKAAHIIRRSCRVDDIVARIGGDEFVLVLPKTSATEAGEIIKQINEILSTEKLGTIDISISFGYSTKDNDEIIIQDVFKKAEDCMYYNKLFESPIMKEKTVDIIIKTLYGKSEAEEQRSLRVSRLCERMGEALELPRHKIEELRTVGLLYDIGKVVLDENLLKKSGKLSEDEWSKIKRHPEIGYRILSTLNETSDIARYVLDHHERWDGKGYPRVLKGEEIAYESRIMAIVDAYDAMTNNRSYRNALPEEEALAELSKNSGAQFDPVLVKVFIEKVLGKTSGEQLT